MLTTGKTVGLAEWIIDDTCLVTWIKSEIHLYFNYRMLHTTSAVYPHKNEKSKVLTGTIEERGESTPVDVTIKLVGEVQPTDHHYIQVSQVKINAP